MQTENITGCFALGGYRWGSGKLFTRPISGNEDTFANRKGLVGVYEYRLTGLGLIPTAHRVQVGTGQALATCPYGRISGS